MKAQIITTITLVLLSCGNKKIDNSQYRSTKLHVPRVEVTKFMGTITTQSRSIDEHTFWILKNEHAKLTINNDGFINDIKELKSNDKRQFEEYNYAFVVFNAAKIDTLYSDFTLKSWILKNKGANQYFYDEKGITVQNLRQSYSFFYDCW